MAMCVYLLIRYSQNGGVLSNIQRCIDVSISILLLSSQVYDLDESLSTGPLKTFLDCPDLTLSRQPGLVHLGILTCKSSNLALSIASSPGLTSLTSISTSSSANSSLFLFRGRARSASPALEGWSWGTSIIPINSRTGVVRYYSIISQGAFKL